MHPHVILNRRMLEAAEARLPAVNAAALYGRGVFTTVAVHKGRPFLWDAHWSRLLAHAERAGVECDFGDNETALMLARLCEANGVEEGRARVVLLARSVRAPPRLAVALLPGLGLLGYLYFTISYPTPDGDVLKASYMLTTAPAWAVAFGYTLDRLPARWRLGAAAVLALCALVSVPFLVY